MIWFSSYSGLIIAVFAAIIFCAFAWQKHWLTAPGAFAALLIAIIILLSGGWLLALPVIVFFITGSVLSKLPSMALTHDKKSKNARDAIQVLCNGGIAAICALLFMLLENNLFIVCYYVSIAVSMSDTASSEAGNFFKGRVVDIGSWKHVKKGLSGGVSLAGTIAGFAGALVIGLLYLIRDNYAQENALIITLAGFAGMLTDSLIGSVLQSKYADETNNVIDYPAAGTRLIKGFGWMTNDAVNFISNLLITGLVYVLLLLI